MKAKSTTVIMVKVPADYRGVSYAPIDKPAQDVLGNRNSFEVQIPVKGRTLPQNNLWGLWYRVIAKDTGSTFESVRLGCKLEYGVPIMCEWDKGFRRIWQAKFADDTDKQKLYIMKYLPVTSLMNKFAGIEYTETLQREFAVKSIDLVVL